MIAYLDVPQSFTDSIVPLICEITFEAKFMIHEKYYACLYLNVLRYLPRLFREELSKDIQMKTKLVSLIVAGLASKMPIVKCICALCISEV